MLTFVAYLSVVYAILVINMALEDRNNARGVFGGLEG